jgi:glycosyl transferase family 2
VKLVMTLRARDEADVVGAQIAFHLNAGVDFVVAIDHRSTDGTTEILESYARQGCLHLISEQAEAMDESGWATHMARLAATEFGADWVISSDADEFWWPRGASLKEVLASVPERYGIVRALLRQFLPRPEDRQFFADRMVVRLSTSAPINHPASFFRPNLKSIHRADPDVTLTAGAHRLVESRLVPLRAWYPVELLHFPIRTYAQCERKYEHLWEALGDARSPYYDEVHRALQEGRFREFYDALTVDEDRLDRGLADGSLVRDTRLSEALRALRTAAADGRAGDFALPSAGESRLSFPRPSVVDDAAYAVDVAALGEADAVRVQRHLDTLEQRLLAIERRPSARLSRKLSSVAKRVLGRDVTKTT